MVAPRALVFRPLVKGNEDSGNEIVASRFMTFFLGHAQKSKLFFAFSLSPFRIFLLLLLSYCYACFQFKNSRESIIKTGNSYHGVAKCSGGKFNFAPSFSLKFLSIFVYISGSFEPITLIWVLLKRTFPPAKLEHK